MIAMIVLALVGCGISLYTYWLEQKVLSAPSYKSVCDINDRVSCTKPMKSTYANIFFFSNALVGFMYYVLIILLTLLELPKFLFIVAVGGVFVSCFLAYLLYFKIKTLCILCTSLYIINFLLLYLSLHF